MQKHGCSSSPSHLNASDANFKLESYKIAQNCTEEFWKEVKDLGKAITCEPHKKCILPDKYPLDIFCIENGSVRTELIFELGQKPVHLSFCSGSIFNLLAAMRGLRAISKIEVLETSQIWCITNRILHECSLISLYPCLAKHMLRMLYCSLITGHEIVSTLSAGFSMQKFCNFLLGRSEIYGNEFVLGATQEECAEMLGIHRATLSRTIKYLKSAGIIEEFTRHKVKILDREKLLLLASR